MTAPSVSEDVALGVVPAPVEWAARVTATLAGQLPEPSVPTRIFLVEKFVMKPMSGKIDRRRLPNLSHLLTNTQPEADDTKVGKTQWPDTRAGVKPGCEEVLEICRAVFKTPLGWDDGFADNGGHSIVMARLAQRLQAAGWVVPVRALLSNCNTPRKVADRPRGLRQTSEAPAGAFDCARKRTERDETAARVLSVGVFTLLQVMFLCLLYAPPLLGFLGLIAFAEIGEFFMTAHLWEFICVGFFMYLFALILPFASLLWVMLIKRFMGGGIYRNNVKPGVYPKWSRMHLRIWCIGPVHLESGCKIGMRAAIANHVTVGRGTWITPFTPIFSDVGSKEMWEGAPAGFSGRFTELKRTASCQHIFPHRFVETLNILMQIFLDSWLLVVPTAAVTWFAVTFIPQRETALASEYFKITPLYEIVWQMGLYAFITTWVTIVLISVLGCLFLRWTGTSPGLYPSRGVKTALLMYRLKKMNQIQRLWTWTITGQYLRALAGVHFNRVGASECDLMLNLVPEATSADSQVFWSHGGFTNMLDYGAEYSTLRRLDMPANFFSSNNCVAESGQFPTNFLLGVSTPGNDIRFRRQMQSRLGEPITRCGVQ